MPSNWPTVDAINARISLSAQSNARPAIALSGLGRVFLKYARKYGINPGFVVALMQKESQLGADGSFLARYHNYAGITDPYGIRSTCPPVSYKNRQWACFLTPEEGIHAVYRVLDQTNYRTSDGTVLGITNIYSPSYENNMDQMLKIMEIVGRQLNIQLKPATPVYTRPSVLRHLIR